MTEARPWRCYNSRLWTKATARIGSNLIAPVENRRGRPCFDRGAVIALCLAGWLLVPQLASARIYQWHNPNSGAVHLSAAPPGWYRNSGAGPRVRVYASDGKLIDDTAIALPAAYAAKLREAAFQESARVQQAETVRRLERAAQREAARQARAERLRAQAAQTTTVANSSAAEPAPKVESVAPDKLDAKTVLQLKSIISTWDRQQAAGVR